MATNLVRSNSDRARFDALKKAASNGQADIEAGTAHISQEQLNEISENIDPYRKAMLAAREAFGARRNALADRAGKLEKLSHNIRDFWTALTNRNKRENLPPGVLEYYRLPTDGGRPKVTTQTRWIQLGEDLIDGEKLAVDKGGYPAMSNPSVAQIEDLLSDAEAANLTVTQADRVYQDVQKKLLGERERVDLMMQNLARTFRYHLADLEPSARRRTMRRYGFVFSQEFEQEGPEPEAPEDEEETLQTVAEGGA